MYTVSKYDFSLKKRNQTHIGGDARASCGVQNCYKMHEPCEILTLSKFDLRRYSCNHLGCDSSRLDLHSTRHTSPTRCQDTTKTARHTISMQRRHNEDSKQQQLWVVLSTGVR